MRSPCGTPCFQTESGLRRSDEWTDQTALEQLDLSLYQEAPVERTEATTVVMETNRHHIKKKSNKVDPSHRPAQELVQ